MPRPLPHPTREQIELPDVLDCLSDPTRLAIVYNLARHDQAATELRCGDFNAFSGKSNLAYHFAKLRQAGLIQTRLVGTTRYMKLRRKDLDARFPGYEFAQHKGYVRQAKNIDKAVRSPKQQPTCWYCDRQSRMLLMTKMAQRMVRPGKSPTRMKRSIASPIR